MSPPFLSRASCKFGLASLCWFISIFSVSSFDVKVGVLLRLKGVDGSNMGIGQEAQAAAALMAVNHIRNKNAVLVPDAATRLHPDLNLTIHLADSLSNPAIGMAETLKWTNDGVSLIVGASRSAVRSAPFLLTVTPLMVALLT